MWKNKHITFFITGGIAVYKVVELIRTFQKAGAEIRVAMTKTAMQFVGKSTFQTISKHPVQTDLFDQTTSAAVAHVELADWTDLAIVAPATANIMSKMANGMADDFVSTTLLALSVPVIVVPAMNVHMWNNAATQRNIQTLRNDNIQVMDPDNGPLAEGYSGKGRFPSNDEIFNYIVEQTEDVDNSKLAKLRGKKVLITAGGTREYIDPVRYISNESSGKMGYALAKVAQENGAVVTLISANVKLPIPAGIDVIQVETVEELAQAVQTQFVSTDVFIMAAAVSDYRPVHFVDHKIKKSADSANLTLELEETTDILKSLKSRRTKQIVVGFAAETNDLLNNAKKKLDSKGADIIVANDVSQSDIGFGSEDNAVTILQHNATNIKVAKANKQIIAKKVLEVIVKRLS